MSVEETEWCWLNGQLMPLRDARVSVEDRGFQFADGVYEAIHIYNGRPFALRQHLDRLDNSCRGMMLALPIERAKVESEILNLVRRCGTSREQFLYLQLTRGACKRNHLIPTEYQPTLLFYVRQLPPVKSVAQQPGAKLISVRDERWQKCWIKAIGLTANILARNEAHAADADEAAFVDDAGIVAECTTSNLFAVIDGKLITHPVGERVLPGVTRDILIGCARTVGIAVQERPLTLVEAKTADEVFFSNTSRQVTWVRQWDDANIGAKSAGPVTLRLAAAFDAVVATATS